MKKFLYMAVAAIAALSSCSSDDLNVNGNANDNNKVNAPVFTATIEGEAQTRTALANGTKVKWVSNDEVKMIYFNSGSSFPVIYQATPGADATTATLNIKAGESLDPQATTLIYAAYPASIFDNNMNTFTIPATQMYEGDGKLTNVPMLYYNSDNGNTPIPTSVSFKNANAVLAVTVPYSELTSVKSITVSSNLAMNGVATYDFTQGNLFIQKRGTTVTEENSKITLDCYTKAGQNVAIPEGGSKTFYIAIPPMNSSMAAITRQATGYGYLQFDVTDGVNTKTMKTKDGVSIEVERNKIYPIAFADNSAPATTGTAKATINGNEVDVEWVQLWADGPKFATQNVASKMIWADAIKTGSNFVWGANWRCPSKDEMAGLQESGNATCNLCNVNGNWFFKFTGVQEGYKSNVIYFPVSSYTKVEEDGEEYEDAYGYYWTSAEQKDEYGYALLVSYADGSYATLFAPLLKSLNWPVRPVLNK